MVDRSSPAGGHKPSVARRDLLFLVSGNAVSTLGNAVYLIAVTLMLKSITESVFMLGLFQFVALAPGFLLSPVAGAIVDRVSRRSVIVVSDLLRGILMIGAGLALFVPELQTPWFLLPVSFLGGVGHAIFVPAVQAILPSLVPEHRLHSATGLRAATSQIANLAGNAAGGALFLVLGAPLLFVFNGVTFVLSAIQEHFISERGVLPGGRAESVLQSARAGLKAVAGNRTAVRLIVSQAGLFALSPVLMLSLPFLLIDDLGMSGEAVGFYYALALVGGILAFAALRTVTSHRLLALPLVGIAYVTLAAGFAGVAAAVTPVVLAAVAVVSGAGAGVVYLYATTWIQLQTAADTHGRYFAMLEAASALAAPVSYLATGLLLQILGVRYRWILFVVYGSAALAWGIRTLFRSKADSAAGTRS